jgi:antirestriction protein ArdC
LVNTLNTKLKKDNTTMRNLHKEITDKIIASLKAGAPAWRKPWSTKPAQAIDGAPILMPRNAVTARPYSGINILLLWARADERQFSDARWLTFKQARELGGTVRKGEKGTEIVFVNHVVREDKNDPDKTVRIPFLKSYYVFNVAQCDGLPAKITNVVNEPEKPALKRNERDAIVDAFIGSTGARIVHSGQPRAFYSPNGDYINMPIFDTFVSGHAYYATAFHELGHWTGAANRLNRTFGKRFGDRAYAAEELVAELTSAFICAEFRIDNHENSAAYLQTWARNLSNFLAENVTAVVSAASHASKAAEYLRSKALGERDEDEAAADLPIAA